MSATAVMPRGTAEPFRMRFLDFELPAALPAGSEVTCRVVVQNTSSASWSARGDADSQPVSLSYHWRSESGRYVTFEGLRTPLPRDLQPGERVELSAKLTVPRQSGHYTLELSLLQEGVAWFHDKGVEPLRLQISLAVDGTYAVRRLPPRWREALRATLTAPFLILSRERHLIWSMARRDMFGRYKGTVGGALWAVINPLLLISVYTFLFAFVLRVRFGAAGRLSDFAFYFICGWLPWMAFSDAVLRAQSVISENVNLVKRVVFPVEILPVNLTLSALLTSLIGLGIFLVALLLSGQPLHATLLLLPVVLVFQVALTLGLGWFLASLGVFVRDVGQILGVVMTMWFFLTPIVYPETAVTPSIRSFYVLNPFFHIVKAYRALVLEGVLPGGTTLAAMAGFGVAAFFLGYAWFRKTQKAFADVL